MKNILAVVMVLVLLASCAKDKDEGGKRATGQTAAGGGVTTGQDQPGRPAIPDTALGDFELAAAAFLRPYFDDAGTETSKAVGYEEIFELYVVAEFSDAFAMSAAEYKLILPEGISVLGTTHTDSMIVTMGKYDEDFMMAFHCMTGPKNWLVKYLCKAEDEFSGGTIETVRGDNLNFIGFVTCDVSRTEIKAGGGTAQLRKK